MTDAPKHRKPRFDRRLTMAQVREIRASTMTGPEWVKLLWKRDRIFMSTVAIWKIRHGLLYREPAPDPAQIGSIGD